MYKSPLFYSLLFLMLGFIACGQDVVPINDGTSTCPMTGSARPHTRSWNENLLKNRYDLVEEENIDTSFTMENLTNYYYDQNAFNQETVGELTAYVIEVKSGGKESCNCYADHVVDLDTHIELALDLGNLYPDQIVIVEITPRMRAMMALKGIDWSTKALKKKYLGQWVTVTGWLFFDHEHVNESTDSDPDDVAGRKNWRSTCWELHPITNIELSE